LLSPARIEEGGETLKAKLEAEPLKRVSLLSGIMAAVL
jgi:hypothetical protein